MRKEGIGTTTTTTTTTEPLTFLPLVDPTRPTKFKIQLHTNSMISDQIRSDRNGMLPTPVSRRIFSGEGRGGVEIEGLQKKQQQQQQKKM